MQHLVSIIWKGHGLHQIGYATHSCTHFYFSTYYVTFLFLTLIEIVYLCFEFQEPRTRAPEAKPSDLELDSSLVKDVNVADGSVLLPLTACTKIWRMRNTGTVAWPQKTRLAWGGGYKLSNQLVELEIPAAGLPVGHELDIAVSFVSPSFTQRL